MRQRQLGQAVALLEEALSLLQRQSRALPGHHATTSLLLGRALRLTMVMPDGPSANGAATNGGGGTSSGGAVGGTTRALEKDSIRSASPSVVLGASAGGAGAKVAVEAAAAVREQLQRVQVSAWGGGGTQVWDPALPQFPLPWRRWCKLAAHVMCVGAQSLLSGAFVLAALDGGHLRDIMRAALLELALLHVAGSSAAQAAACLRHAQVSSLAGRCLDHCLHCTLEVQNAPLFSLLAACTSRAVAAGGEHTAGRAAAGHAHAGARGRGPGARVGARVRTRPGAGLWQGRNTQEVQLCLPGGRERALLPALTDIKLCHMVPWCMLRALRPRTRTWAASSCATSSP